MAHPPFMQFYVDEYLADTGHLTAEEHGVYLLLIMVAFRSGGSIKNDDHLLARYSKLTVAKWRKIAPTILPFFVVENGCLSHKRVQRELKKYLEKCEKNSQNGKRGGEAKSLKNNDTDLANATNSLGQNPSENLANSELRTQKEETLRFAQSPDGALRDGQAEPHEPLDRRDWPPDVLGIDGAKAVAKILASPVFDPSKSQGLFLSAPKLHSWFAAGASWRADVLPVLQAVTASCAKRGTAIRSFGLFDEDVGNAMATRLQHGKPVLSVVPAMDPAERRQRDLHDGFTRWGSERLPWPGVCSKPESFEEMEQALAKFGTDLEQARWRRWRDVRLDAEQRNLARIAANEGAKQAQKPTILEPTTLGIDETAGVA